MDWLALHPTMQSWMLGELPGMLDESDPRPAREQFHERYAHGGGWRPFSGFTLNKDFSISYPGDPPMLAIAMTKLRDEIIILSECSWVTILQPDGSHETCRMD